MGNRDGKVRRSALRGAAPATTEQFAESLKQRREAAQGLERDLITEVPMLYGSPTLWDDPANLLKPYYDPGIELARIHRDEMVRRNGGGIFNRSRSRSDVRLPFERTMIALSILVSLLAWFAW